MKPMPLITSVIALSMLVYSPPCPAQISVETGDGTSVKIAPEGIKVRTSDPKGGTAVDINLGGGSVTTRSTSGGSSVSVQTHSSSKTANKQAVKAKSEAHAVGKNATAAKSALKTSVKTRSGSVTSTATTSQSQSRVARPAASSGPRMIQVTGTGQTTEYKVNGDSVTVDASGCTVTLKGHCDSLVVKGTGNTVDVDTVNTVSVSGMGNVVNWSPECSPGVDNQGLGNSAEPRQ